MHVTHSTTSLDVGGAQHMLVRFVAPCVERGHIPTIISLRPAGSLTDLAEAAGADVVSLNMRSSLPKPADFFRMRQLVRSRKSQILHGWMYHGNLAASFGSGNVPVIWSIHHSLSDLDREKTFTRHLLRISARMSASTAAISYCSRSAADQHEAIGFDASRRVVIPNGTDCDVFRPTDERQVRLRKMLNLPESRMIVGHVGRYHPMKDQASLVRAIARLLNMGFDIQGVFLGEGHEDGIVRREAQALGIDDRICTLGLRTDVAELLPGMDVGVNSSMWGEAFSLAVAESMASGVPEVVTDVGDSAWLVGSTGIVVPPGDCDALAEGIGKILRLEPDQRRALGVQARARILAKFTLGIYVDRHLALYEAALADTQSRCRRALVS